MHGILHITDTHLFASDTASLYDRNPAESLAAVVADARANTLPAELILVTGDLANDETPAAYDRLATALEPLGLPFYCLPGNHDTIALLQSRWPDRCATSDLIQVRLDQWQLLLLNSAVPGQVAGRIHQAQLDRLEACLQADSRFALVAVHHPPVSVQSPWMDTIGLTNGDQLLTLLARYPHARLVLFGHVHQEFRSRIGEIIFYATPSTCYQFKPRVADMEIDDRPPGYRHLMLKPDGSVDTRVYWLEDQ